MFGTKNSEMDGMMCAPIRRGGEADSRQRMDNMNGRYGGSRTQTPARYGCKLWHEEAGRTATKTTARESCPGYNG